MRYNSFSSYLKKKYGEKVYKIPVNLQLTCPNRDGNVGCGGCIFCGEEGAAFPNLPQNLEVKKQIEENIKVLSKKYKANKFIVYFQNFTNTYMPLEAFKNMINEVKGENICALYISTRPDCIRGDYLEFLKEFSIKTGYDICIELGLQTVNYKTLEKLNRSHTLAEFIDSVITIKKYGFEICAHLILNLPWDDMSDVLENAKILSALKINQVKIHSLYIEKGTTLSEMYEKGEIKMDSVYDYIEKVITFLQYLSPEIVIQRLVSRAKTGHTLFSNYGLSWWKIKDNIEKEMELRDTRQGDKFDYLSGKALKSLKFKENEDKNF